MNRKFFAAAAAVGLCLAGRGVMAATIDSIDFDMGGVTVCGSAEPNSSVQITVVRKGAQANNPDEVFAIGELVCPENGKFSFEFEIADEEERGIASPGECICYAMENGGKKAEYEFQYATKSELEKLLLKIKEDNGISGVFGDEENAIPLKILGFKTDEFNMLGADAKASLLSEFDKNNNVGGMSAKELTETFNTDTGISLINSSAEKGFEILSAQYMGRLYTDISDKSEKEYIKNYIMKYKPYSGKTAFDTRYGEASALYVINHSISANMIENLEKNKTALRLSESASYKAWRSKDTTAQGKITEKLVTMLRSSAAGTVEALHGYIKDAVSAYDLPNKSAGGGGGGGGGVKTSGGVPQTNIPNVMPNGGSNLSDRVFTDVADDFWAYSYIDEMYKLGVISGYDDGEFKPGNSITRAEFVKLICDLCGITDESKKCEFSDVDKNDWFYKYVASAYSANIINGDNGKFMPNVNISRQDVAVILDKCAESIEYIRENNDFSDKESIGEYAKEAAVKLYRAGIINGKENNCFAPQDCCTRAEACAMLWRAYESKFLR